MIKLIKIALKKPAYRLLLLLTMISICFLTVASQLEIFALGVITKNGAGIVENSAKDPDILQKGIIAINKIFPINNNMKNLALMIVLVAFFKALVLFSHRYTTKLVAIRVSRDLRQQYFEHIQSMPLNFYQKYNIGSLSARVVGDANTIAEAINSGITNYLQTPFTILTTLILCFITSWKLSLLIFFGFPLIIGPIVFLTRKVKKVSRQIQKNQEKFTQVLIDFLIGIQTVKVFAMEEFSLKKYQEQNDHLAHLEQKSAKYDLSTRPIVHTIGMFFLSGALISGLYLMKMSVAEIFFYCGLLYLFYEPVKKFAEENTRIQRGSAAAERMYEVMELKPNIVDQDGAEKFITFEGDLEFDNVWFRYEEHWILKGISFRIKKGETVAIVGPTGSGKSTLVQLLPRLYDIQEGEIRIGGKSIKTYTQRSLRDNIGFVPQKPFLFYDTVAENISFGRKFSFDQISEAAKKAHADKFIQALPNGYQTELSEAGKNLSGGQQQRLAIARALVKNAPILVMDEATSSLDNISEYHIKTAMKHLHGKVTQIIIAHRLSTIEEADRIIYLDRGEIISIGTKEELLKTCSGFKAMWEKK